MFNHKAFANSRPDGIAVLEVVGEGPRRFVPLRRTHVGGEVIGPLAALGVTHTFRYTRAECAQVLEAVYRFPLPGDAAVTGVVVTFGEVEIRATLKARKEAEEEFEAAKREGKQAALVSREAADVFTLQVAGLHPDEEVSVETTYVQLAEPDGIGWSLRLPLTTAPRYTRGDERGSPATQGQPLAVLRDPGHRFSLDLLVPGAETIRSTTHQLRVEDEDGRTRVRLRDGQVVPDRDCVLTWFPRQAEGQPSLAVATYDDQAEDYTYFLALVAPPAARGSQAVGREVVLLKDVSGSMSGAKHDAANWAARKLLAGLGPQEYFALQLFDSDQHWLERRSAQATPEAIARAQAFLANFPGGGTELGVALEQALRLGREGQSPARHVLILTDAQISDAERVLRLAEEEFARADRRRISVLCIDAAPNSYLALELARRGGGAARFLTSNPDEVDIATALDAILADWSQPVLAGLRLEMNRPGVLGAERQALNAGERGWSALDLGDLPAGRSIWVAGRVPRGEGADLRFRLRAGAGEALAEGAGSTGLPALKALFGARRLLGLEFLMGSGYTEGEVADHLRHLGYDPDRDLQAAGGGQPLYPENARREGREALTGLLGRESLAYGLASSVTSFVAVRQEAGKPVEETVVVANALPAGWSEDFLSRGGALGMAAMMPSPMAGATRLLRRLSSPPTRMAQSATPPADLGAGASRRFQVGEFDRSAPARRGRREGIGGAEVFRGRPTTTGAERVLYDSDNARDKGKGLPGRFTALHVAILDRSATTVDPDLELLLYVGDLAAPRARVRLSDILSQGGARPLNLVRNPGERVLLVLADPHGAWSGQAPEVSITLA